jgi:hypothetical protein
MIIVFAILGALWRRWFGGWPITPGGRWPKLVVSFALGVLATMSYLPWEWCILVSLAAMVFWIPGHKLTEWTLTQWLFRYGPLGIFWWAANRYGDLWKAKWNWGPFDGTFAIAEMLGGAALYGGLAAISLL